MYSLSDAHVGRTAMFPKNRIRESKEVCYAKVCVSLLSIRIHKSLNHILCITLLIKAFCKCVHPTECVHPTDFFLPRIVIGGRLVKTIQISLMFISDHFENF